MPQEITKNTIKRYACELCNCGEFSFCNADTKYKCTCGHGDVWHSRHNTNAKKDKIKQLFRPLIKLFNKPKPASLNKECPICFTNIKKLVVFSCGHGFCSTCSDKILYICPSCRANIDNKISVYI